MLRAKEGNTVKKIQIQDELVVANISECAQLLREAMASASKGIQLDFADVEECDSSGVQLILSAHKTALEENKSFAICAASEAIHDAFHCVGIDDMNAYFSTER